MSTVAIYQFQIYDVANDEMRKSRRWATREAIERLGGETLEHTCTEVDNSVLDSGITGMTVRDFDPRRVLGFQRQVKT